MDFYAQWQGIVGELPDNANLNPRTGGYAKA